MAGKFIDFYLPFKENDRFLSAKEQAERIITYAQDLLKDSDQGVAITYSANYDQTITINETYSNGGWYTRTSGSNQAQVISALEELLKSQFIPLQHLIRIAPITTLTYSSFKGKTHEQIIREDLENIKALLDKGWDVLGWMNQLSKPNYAVGGGVVQLPSALSEIIQNTLKSFSSQYR